MSEVRVITAGDHPLFRAATSQAVRPGLPGAPVVEADSVPAGHAGLAADPDVELPLVDPHMPGAAGLLDEQIAFEPAISEATATARVTAIMRKLGVRTRTQAAFALGGVELPPRQQRQPGT